MICRDCGGTGIYVGFAEHDGAGIICRYCCGKRDVDDLNVRGIRWVYPYNPGITLGEDPSRSVFLHDFGGMSYQDWLAGRPFVVGMEMRKFVCPAWFYQGCNGSLKPRWDECSFGQFSRCSSFGSMEECWKKWDREFGQFLKDGIIQQGNSLLLPMRSGFVPEPAHKKSDEDDSPVI